GGFYLDIIKDRQYTTGTDSLPRRSAQTSLFHLAEVLCRWIAPILSFTAEELWENLPGPRSASVFLAEWYEALPDTSADDNLDAAFWSEMVVVRQQVNKALELAREQGTLRGSLDAEVALYAGPELVDGDGRKMSKSLGNIIPAGKAMQDLGADVLRLYVSAADYRNEISASDEIFKRTADAYRRIRNTARFLLANLAGFDPVTDCLPVEQLLPLDRWILGQAQALQAEVRTAYDDYQFHLVYHRIHNFCSGELGGFYLDIIKDRQYTTGTDSLPRRSAQTSLFHLAEVLCRWIAPILSFTAEELWENLPGPRSASVFLAEWYEALPDTSADDNLDAAFWSEMVVVRQQVNKALELAREQGMLRGSLDADVALYAGPELAERLRSLGEELRFVLITSEATVASLSEAPSEAYEAEDMALRVVAVPSTSEKCERCWHRRPDVGEHAAHPTLCGRCVTNIEGPGEVRHFA
ncbi:MAG: hypothetical protein EVA62_01305, partial [Halieaceae bacterium]